MLVASRHTKTLYFNAHKIFLIRQLVVFRGESEKKVLDLIVDRGLDVLVKEMVSEELRVRRGDSFVC